MFCEIALCFFLVPATVLRDRNHQALAGTKKTNLIKHWQAPKKVKNATSQHLLRTLDPIDRICLLFCSFGCLPVFCEIALLFVLFWGPATDLKDRSHQTLAGTKTENAKKQSTISQNTGRHQKKQKSKIPASTQDSGFP